MQQGGSPMKEWLAKHRIEEHFDKLVEQGFEEPGDFSECSETDLRELSSSLELKPGHRTRLLRAVRTIPGSKLSQSRTSQIIILDQEQQSIIESVEKRLSNLSKAIDFTDTEIKEVTDKAVQLEANVKGDVQKLIETLQKRERALIEGIRDNKNAIIEHLDDHKKKLQTSVEFCTKVKTDCWVSLQEDANSEVPLELAQQKTQLVKTLHVLLKQTDLPRKYGYFGTHLDAYDIAKNLETALNTTSAHVPAILDMRSREALIRWTSDSAESERFKMEHRVYEEKSQTHPEWKNSETCQIDAKASNKYLDIHGICVLKYLEPNSTYEIRLRKQHKKDKTWSPYAFCSIKTLGSDNCKPDRFFMDDSRSSLLPDDYSDEGY